MYIGRFAPSPTGELHLGSLACALASFLDARAHGGLWLIRIEDIDSERCKEAYTKAILDTLKRFGFPFDQTPVIQSEREDHYASAFQTLLNAGDIYPCTCSRSEIQVQAKRPGVYPGTCRNGCRDNRAKAWRLRVENRNVTFTDRLAGTFTQNLETDVGDFILKRADGLWAYQMAVVVDDAEQKITDVVRGKDLLDNTPRQLFLQEKLAYPHPRYMHIDLVKNDLGQKLSKQNKATAITRENPIPTLNALMPHFGLPIVKATSLQAFFKTAIELWKDAYVAKTRVKGDTHHG